MALRNEPNSRFTHQLPQTTGARLKLIASNWVGPFVNRSLFYGTRVEPGEPVPFGNGLFLLPPISWYSFLDNGSIIQPVIPDRRIKRTGFGLTLLGESLTDRCRQKRAVIELALVSQSAPGASAPRKDFSRGESVLS